MNIFMTGGAGFLGRAILRHYEKENPKTRFTIFSRDEAKHDRVRRLFPQHKYILGDIGDYPTVEQAMAGHDTVIHAAAMKYVPQGESNVLESIRVNVHGSINVARAAVRMGVERVVGISTDKACQPVNVYGMTKLMMERAFQEFNETTPVRFALVRYGNVISSTGSVIPLFRRQIRERGRVTLTNPEMTRFWLPIDEAVALVREALIREGRDGDILIPRAPAMSMLDLIRACGLAENGNADPVYDVIGQRFGEKVHEELIGQYEIPYAALVVTGWPSSTCIVLSPVTRGVNPAPLPAPYRSDQPDKVISISEMADMIRQAPE